MQKWKAILASTIAAATLVAVANQAAAANGLALATFNVTDINGAKVSTSTLAQPGNWILIYVQQDNRASDLLLQSINSDTYQALADKIVIIVGGALPGDLSDWTKRYPKLVSAGWYADSNHLSIDALQLGGAPDTLGISTKGNASQIDWQVSGSPKARSRYDSIVLNWLGVKLPVQ